MATDVQLYGQDIRLDEAFGVPLAANGEPFVTSGPETALQDIRLRLFTPLGGLFYDRNFGSDLVLFVKDENTLTNRLALEVEVATRIEMDPRVKFGTVTASVVKWDHAGVMIHAEFHLIEEPNPFNLVIKVGTDMGVVIRDVDPSL